MKLTILLAMLIIAQRK